MFIDLPNQKRNTQDRPEYKNLFEIWTHFYPKSVINHTIPPSFCACFQFEILIIGVFWFGLARGFGFGFLSPLSWVGLVFIHPWAWSVCFLFTPELRGFVFYSPLSWVGLLFIHPWAGWVCFLFTPELGGFGPRARWTSWSAIHRDRISGVKLIRLCLAGASFANQLDNNNLLSLSQQNLAKF